MVKTVVLGLMLSVHVVMADPGMMADGDVMRMMGDWKQAEKSIIMMQTDKADPSGIMALKRQNNDLKQKIEGLSQGKSTLETAWGKTQSDVKTLRDQKGLIQYPSQEREKQKDKVASYYDGQLKELDGQLRVAEESRAKREQEIGLAGIQGTMDEATKQRERESAREALEAFKRYTDSERSRLEAEKTEALAAVK